MKIFITIPSLIGRNGGLRIIGEWCNRLSRIGHDVTLYNSGKGGNTCDWFRYDESVTIVTDTESLKNSDCLIISSPHDIGLQTHQDCPAKVFLFLQMMEHLFNHDPIWQSKCYQFYISRHPLFSISQWNIEALQTQFNRTSEIIYIGNGVNLEDFPIVKKPKSGLTVLVEGWEPGNPTKDAKYLGANVARKLKGMGYTVLAYGSVPIKTLRTIPHEYHCRPDIATLNSLYERATILIKATRFDARSCSPMEAMTKGTVTVRAIEQGDDDLTDDFNCLRVSYNYQPMVNACQKLMNDRETFARLSGNCLAYVQSYTWDYWIKMINDNLCKDFHL